jgi:hypothetical protein
MEREKEKHFLFPMKEMGAKTPLYIYVAFNNFLKILINRVLNEIDF